MKCGKFGHSARACQNNSTMATQDQTYKGENNIQMEETIRYPTPMSPARPLVLTQQITAAFQLLQESWNKLSSQMSKMAKTDKLLK